MESDENILVTPQSSYCCGPYILLLSVIVLGLSGNTRNESNI